MGPDQKLLELRDNYWRLINIYLMAPQGQPQRKEWMENAYTTHNTKMQWSQWTKEENSSSYIWK